MYFSRALWRAGLMFTLLMVLSACTVADENSSTVPDGWVTVEVGNIFSLKAPPGTVLHKGAGIDSIVGTIDAPHFKLSFDYGVYSGALTKEDYYKNYKSKEIQIDSVAARIVTANNTNQSVGHPYLIGVHFPQIKKSSLGSIKLTIHCFLENEESYATVEKIFHTIKLKQKQ